MCAAKNNKNKKPRGVGNLDFSMGLELPNSTCVGGSRTVADMIAKGIGAVAGCTGFNVSNVSNVSKGIAEDKPLAGTCGVCGTPIHPLMTGVPVETGTCKVCHQKVCAKHFSRSKQICSKCSTGNDSWCKTPKL